MDPVKIVAVLGATGNQGGGVVQALLENNPQFSVRAITRDIHSTSAQQLRAKYENSERLQFVGGDVYDKESLVSAFNFAYGIFVVTNNRLPPGKLIENEEDLEHELVAGRNVIDAAKICNVQHVVISSLPNIASASKGRYTKVFHFDHKFRIEEWAKTEFPATTVLHPGKQIQLILSRLFYTNMQWPQYCQRQADGVVRFCAPVPGDKLADWVDPSYDIGIYAAKIFALGPEKTASKTYPVVGEKIKFADFARIFKEVTSQEAIFDPISLDEWGAIVAGKAGKGFQEDIIQMMQWIADCPDDKICYGTMDRKDDESWKDLGVKASSFADWIKRSGWKGPA
ncbi:hypothetical protein F5884DRAFT_676222 [Xylogone sp. PMI_703]|nr:hypothetical protein F5884DRAFT_676222 [Xylogone sp. PMI_703]